MSANRADGGIEERVERFLVWFRQHGGVLCPLFKYAQDKKMGLSIFSSSELNPDIEAISVPKKCCITAPLARRQVLSLIDQPGAIDGDTLTGKEWVIFYLFMHKVVLLWDGRGKSSKHTPGIPPKKRSKTGKPSLESHLLHLPYVELLPQETLTPLHYSKEEIALLTSTPLYSHAIENRRDSRLSCVKALQWLHSQRRKAPLFDDDDINELYTVLEIPEAMLSKIDSQVATDLTIEAQEWGADEDQWPVLKQWRWAETAFGSRAFPPRLLGEEAERQHPIAPVLIPGLDIFNHCREAKVTWTFHKQVNEHVTLTLHQPVLKDKQVFNSYGPKSNQELIASYGFVNDEMDDDYVTLKLGGGHQRQSAQQHHWRYKEKCPPLLLEEVQTALRLFPNRNDLVRDDDEEHDIAASNSDNQFVLEAEAMDTIAGLLEAKIDAFDKTQKQVDAALSNDNSTSTRESIRHCITIYRASQIRILRSALDQVHHRLDEIEALLECKEQSEHNTIV